MSRPSAFRVDLERSKAAVMFLIITNFWQQENAVETYRLVLRNGHIDVSLLKSLHLNHQDLRHTFAILLRVGQDYPTYDERSRRYPVIRTADIAKIPSSVCDRLMLTKNS